MSTEPSSEFKVTCSALLSLYFVGLAFFLAGFSSSYWQDAETYHAGLWRECTRPSVSGIWHCNYRDLGAYESKCHNCTYHRFLLSLRSQIALASKYNLCQIFCLKVSHINYGPKDAFLIVTFFFCHFFLLFSFFVPLFHFFLLYLFISFSFCIFTTFLII